MKIGSAISGASLLVCVVYGIGCHRETAISTTGARTDGLTAPTAQPAALSRVIRVVAATPGGTTVPVPDVVVGVDGQMKTTGADGSVSVPMPQGERTPLTFQASGFLTFETLVRNGEKFNVRPSAQGDIRFLAELHHDIIRPPDPGKDVTIVLDAAIFAYAPGRPAIDRAKDQMAHDLGVAVNLSSEPVPGTTQVRMVLDPSLSGETGGTGYCDYQGNVAQGGEIRIGNLDYLAQGEYSAIFVFHELAHALLCLGHTTAPSIMNPATMYSGPLADPAVSGAIAVESRGGRIPGTYLDVARGLETDRKLGGSGRDHRDLDALSDKPPRLR